MSNVMLRGIVGLALGASIAQAQWSSNGATNLTVAGGAGDQGVPLVRATQDGGAWISFADNSLGAGYKHMIQRVTSKGAVVFPGMGIQLDNRTNSATFVFDMEVDGAGNAIVAFDSNATTAPLAVQKVLPDGTLPWGPTGVSMPNSTGTVGPQVAALGDGTYVCSWALSNILYFQRINADGTLGVQWTYTDTGHYQAISDLLPGPNAGEVISLWVRGSTTNFTTSIKGLRLQKWDGSNAQVWNSGAPVEVMTYLSGTPGRSIQNGYFPPIVSDGAGGAIVAWYEVGNANRQARLQHVLGSGTSRFVADGLPLSTTLYTTEYRSSATVAYDASADTYTIGYERSNPTQSLWGMAAQHVDAAGNLLWNSGAGTEIVPFGSFHAASFINAAPGPNHSTIFTWIQYQGNSSPMVINATRMDAGGNFVWTPTTLGVSTTPNTKGRLSAALTSRSGMIIAGWADGASGSADLQAQNINVFGTLGPICDADLDDGSGAGYPDGGIDINDLLFFLAKYEAGSLGADLDNGSGTGTPDGGVDINDLLFFLAHYESGC